MARLASTLLVVALLGGTAAAFAITEELKLEESPITKPRIAELFSPVSEAGTGTADLGFTLRDSGRVTVAVVDSGGEEVRTLARAQAVEPGAVMFSWDGRDEAGRVVPDGSYFVRVRLHRARRTIRIPNAIRVDSTRPRITVASVRPRVMSPDRDGRRELVRIRYRIDEPARALLLVDGRQQVRGKLRAEGGELRWFGKVRRGGRARPLRAGRYTVEIRAEDEAGNVSRPTRRWTIRIRYVELRRDVVRVPSGARFRLGVATDAKNVRWVLGRGSAVSRRRVLVLRAPREPGRYTLYVTANGRADKATVIVSRRR